MKVFTSLVVLLIVLTLTMSQVNTTVSRPVMFQKPIDSIESQKDRLHSPPQSLIDEINKLEAHVKKFEKHKKLIASTKPSKSKFERTYVKSNGKVITITEDSVYTRKKKSWLHKIFLRY